MSNVEGLLFSKEHEWVRVEGDKAYIGISDYAQDSLGDIVFVELPGEGMEFERDQPFSVVESVKAASDIYIPVSGKIMDVNLELEDEPERINDDPYGSWICIVEMTDKSQLDDLMDYDTYIKMTEEE